MNAMLKKILNKNTVFVLTTILVALHPIIELDELAYDFLNQFGLPRLTTIVDMVILPLLVILTFVLFEKKKKRVAIFASVYAVLFGAYFALHCHNANYLQYNMHLPNNFIFLLSDEIIYTITLFLPLVYIWVFYLQGMSEAIFKKVVVTLSLSTALPIFVSNLFVFGRSTYQGFTIDNFLSWFSLPFDVTTHHPRLYATKFFFEEGNTIGILMIMLLPFLYYFMHRSSQKKEKISLGVLIVIHSLAMIILSTRIATYGAVLVPIAMLAIYIILFVLKYEAMKPFYVAFLIVMTVISGVIIPFGPAYQNQLIDALDYGFQKENDAEKNSKKENIKRDGEGLEPFSKEWLDYYTYIFEDNAFMIGVTPPVYYKEWYDYKLDPKFWVDLIFDYELEERVNGRQIQNIFTHYKYDPLTSYQKALGMGYSTFMRGSILLERDFAQQYFSYGPVGFVFIMAPWFVVVAYLGIKLLLGFKKKKWTYLNVTLMMAFCIGLVSSYVSGHTLDELTSSLFIALCAGMLLQNLKVEHE